MSPDLAKRAVIRPIVPADDAAMARIIRIVMPEFGACGEGFAIVDPEVDALFAAYSKKGSLYLVLEMGGEISGGAGYGPLKGGEPGVCELRKMYLMRKARGLGLGRALLDRLLVSARADGYSSMYLETFEPMTGARRLYEASGFRLLTERLGDTGHFACKIWYLKEL